MVKRVCVFIFLPIRAHKKENSSNYEIVFMGFHHKKKTNFHLGRKPQNIEEKNNFYKFRILLGFPYRAVSRTK